MNKAGVIIAIILVALATVTGVIVLSSNQPRKPSSPSISEAKSNTGKTPDTSKKPYQSQNSTPPYSTPSITYATPPSHINITVTTNDETADKKTISVVKGTMVSLTIKVDNSGTYNGGLRFESSDPEVSSTGTIDSGSSKTIEFTAAKSFSFTPYWPSQNVKKNYTIQINVT